MLNNFFTLLYYSTYFTGGSGNLTIFHNQVGLSYIAHAVLTTSNHYELPSAAMFPQDYV